MSQLTLPEKGTLLTEERMKELLNEQTEVIKKLIASIPAPEPEPEPEEPKPEPVKDCDRPIKIGLVTKKSDNRIQVKFDAKNVFKMLASVKQKDSGKTVVVADVISNKTGKSLLLDKVAGYFGPDDNSPIIVLGGKLDANTRHTVTLKATECTSEDSYDFFFDEVVVPPPEPEKPCKPEGTINGIKLTQK